MNGIFYLTIKVICVTEHFLVDKIYFTIVYHGNQI